MGLVKNYLRGAPARVSANTAFGGTKNIPQRLATPSLPREKVTGPLQGLGGGLQPGLECGLLDVLHTGCYLRDGFVCNRWQTTTIPQQSVCGDNAVCFQSA